MSELNQTSPDAATVLKAAQSALMLVDATLPLIESAVRDSQISPEEHKALFDFLGILARKNPYQSD